MSKSIFAFFSFFPIITAIFAGSCIGVYGEVSQSDKVVMVVADYINIEDINKMDFLDRLSSRSHMALVSNRQSGKAGACKSKLIIGSGKMLDLSEDMKAGGNANSFGRLFRLQGGRVLNQNNLVYNDIYKLRNKNRESEYRSYIGYIGEAINQNKGSSCFIGNADTNAPNRSSMLLAIDNSGLIDMGETENLNKTDELFPYEKRTDYKKLAELYKQYLPASSFLLIETGDMERLEEYKNSMFEEAYDECRQTALRDMDEFIRELINYGEFKTFIFISTFPSKTDMEAGNKLTPLVVYEGGASGLLYSSSTRREGIIVNTDIADFILHKLGYLNSCSVYETYKQNPAIFLSKFNKEIVNTSTLRPHVLTFYALLIISTLTILLIWLIFGNRNEKIIPSKPIKLLSYVNLSFPIMLLFLPTNVSLGKWTVYAALISAGAMLIALAAEHMVKHELYGVIGICSLTFIGLVFDTLTGSSLMKQSVMGYDPIIGARFYGIGNEYAGVFIGSSILVLGCVMEIKGAIKKSYTILFFTGCTAVLGLTFTGANFGGAVAGAFGYVLAYFLFYGIKFSKRNTAAGIIILFLTALLMISLDLVGIGSSSHVGGIVKDTSANGVQIVLSTIERKLSMNLRLIRSTIWTKVLLCIIAVIAYLLYKPTRLLKDMFKQYVSLKHAWAAAAASAIAGFAVNDSGVVLAATAMIFVVFTMLIILAEKQESRNGL